MRMMMRILPLAVLIVAAAFSLGCEDSPLSAGADYTMTLIAQPQTVVVNPAEGIDSAQAVVVATVLNKDSVAQQGITVYFSNKGGTLTSGKNGVTTNAAGVASDTLTVTDIDPAEIDVTAYSAALTQTVKITKTTVPVNHPPIATVVATPSGEQASGSAVAFDGTGSNDPDTGDTITMYRWSITSTNHDVAPNEKPTTITAEGPGASGISFPNATYTAFTNVQDLTVKLDVTDDPAVVEGSGWTARGSAQIVYHIVAASCAANTKPTAVIAGAATQYIYGAAGTEKTFPLDGTLSTDPETPIETYTWTCGNNYLPVSTGPNFSTANCKYLVDGTPRTYTATLVVTDRGTGNIVGGSYECAASSTPASVQIVVSPLAGP